jgi:AcrR family transcriptional regulator
MDKIAKPDPEVPCASGDLPRWTRRKDARPGELIDAALDLFVERGFAATRIDDVATRAGVSKGTVYLYFRNKEELFKEVVRATLVKSIAEGVDLVHTFTGSSSELLRTIMFRWWSEIGNTRSGDITKLIMAEAGNFPEIAKFYSDEVVDPASRMLGAILERGIQHGEFRALDVPMTVQMIKAPVVLMMLWQASIGPCAMHPLPDPARYVDHVIDVALHGMLVPPAGSPGRTAKLA